ncbi:amidohydrolase family protein [Comamonadaceae bacterium G21597-S1]|nr:amidohydrolase family protein [Comamonadaceae bacterium G21597-S1]
MTVPDITGGMPAIDNHSHASASRFRSIDQIKRYFATAHLESNVPSEVYVEYIAARNAGDSDALDELEKRYRTESLMQEGLKFRSTTFFETSLHKGAHLLYGETASDQEISEKAIAWSAKGASYAYDQATRVANTPVVVADVPYIDRAVWDPQRYRQILRVDPYLYPFFSREAEGRGTEYQRFHGVFSSVLETELKASDLSECPQEFDVYLQFVDHSIRRRVANGAVGLKIASAYVRKINFSAATYAEAKSVYEALAAGKHVQTKQLEDFMIFRIANYAVEESLPIQIHVGMGHPEPGMLIANSAPFELEEFLNTRSLNRLKVTLLHGGYPYSSQLAALAQTYGNVFIDFSWMPYLHHFYLRQKLSEWLEILPANKLLFGSDTGSPEYHVAAAYYARDTLNRVLNDGCNRGVWTAKQVEWLASRILFENTADIYRFELPRGAVEQ